MSVYDGELSGESNAAATGGVETHRSAQRAGEVAAVRGVSLWVSALMGVGAGLAGLLPWVITGMRMPLQNLWAVEVLPDEMPIVLLPFSQYALILMIGLLLTGAAVGGLAARAVRPRAGQWGAVAMFLGLIVVQFTAIVQTFAVARDGLKQSTSATVYLTVVTAVAVLAMLSGIAVFWLVSRAPRAGALIGCAMASVALAPWVSGLVRPFGSVQVGAAAEFGTWAARLLWWAPAVLIGVSIAWCGIRSVGRVVAALVSLVLLWTVPALATATSYAAGSRVLASDLHAMAATGLSMFKTEATSLPVVLPPLGVALVVAVIVRLALQHHLIRR